MVRPTSGSADVTVVLQPGQATLFGLAPDPAPNALRWARITSTTGTPIVVSRVRDDESSPRIPAAALPSRHDEAQGHQARWRQRRARAPPLPAAGIRVRSDDRRPRAPPRNGYWPAVRWIPRSAQVVTATNPTAQTAKRLGFLLAAGSAEVRHFPAAHSKLTIPPGKDGQRHARRVLRRSLLPADIAAGQRAGDLRRLVALRQGIERVARL